MKRWDVIIVGAGPAGIFTALELTEKLPGASVLMLEKGPEIHKRICPRNTLARGCRECSPCSIVSGWGGAGAFSDGKLTLTPRFGGLLPEYVGRQEATELIEYVDEIWKRFGAPDRVFGADEEAVSSLVKEAARAGLELIPARIRHLGTDKCPDILKAMYTHLKDKVEIRTGVTVDKILIRDGKVHGVALADGTSEVSATVVVAPGREGAWWFSEEAERIGLSLEANPVDIGVRVEVPAVLTDEITDKIWEFKIHYYSRAFDDLVRTFCVCPRGEVVMENSAGVITVNGHSYSGKRTENTNFAVLVSKTFTEPFKEPIAYGKNIATLANMLGGGVLVQRLGDLWEGRRSTARRLAKGMVEPTLKDATPGDLMLVLPYRYVMNILEMLEALEGFIPGVWSRHTLLYGVEVKFYSSRVKVNSDMETEIPGLFAVGDGAGITRGLAQASASGVRAARAIVRRMQARP